MMNLFLVKLSYLFLATGFLALSSMKLLAQAPETEATNSYAVQVFFPIAPAQSNDFTNVEPVTRTTDNLGVARFAIEQLIAGPTNTEQQQGLIDPIELTGESICGRDFTIAIANNTAKLQFCRSVPTAGVGDDARITTAITRTLTQFPTVNNVVILNREGNCFKDASGKNSCLTSSSYDEFQGNRSQSSPVPVSPTENSTPTANELPPDVQSAVLEAAASRTSRTVSTLRILEAEPRKWSNGCLGISEPNQLCTQVITPGWQVVVTDGRRNWTYRTDDMGDVVKLEESP